MNAGLRSALRIGARTIDAPPQPPPVTVEARSGAGSDTLEPAPVRTPGGRSAAVTRPNKPRHRSWIRRVPLIAAGAITGALLVGSSLGLSGAGNADHSASRVSTPVVQVEGNGSTTSSSTTTAPAPVIVEAPAPSPEQVAAAQLAQRLASGERLEYSGDFPDPYVLRDGDRTYFFGTNGHGANVPVLDEQAMLAGAAPIDALPNAGLGSWARPDVSRVWAPSVAKLEDGRYAMFYSAEEKTTGLMGIGVAYASSPTGPFADPNAAPILSTASGAAGVGGVIDASVFQENGKTYLVFKNDGNCCAKETAIWLQEFSGETGGVVGSPSKLLGGEGKQAWEVASYTHGHALIEGPTLIADQGKYYLFYSANAWESSSYGINYAVSDSLAGPFTRAPGPWTQSGGADFGPGGQELFRGPGGELLMAYHAWSPDQVGYEHGGARRLIIEPVQMEAGVPVRVTG